MQNEKDREWYNKDNNSKFINERCCVNESSDRTAIIFFIDGWSYDNTILSIFHPYDGEIHQRSLGVFYEGFIKRHDHLSTSEGIIY